MRYGQIESFDPQTGAGTIWTADAPRPLPFTSKESFSKGDCVVFDTAVVCVNVRRNTQGSPIQVDDVRSDAAIAARGTFNPAYHRQAGDAAAIAQQEKK